MSNEETMKIVEAVKAELVVTFKAMMPEMQKTVAESIEARVNGGVRDIKKLVEDEAKVNKEFREGAEEHRERVDEFIKDMQPAKDAITWAAISKKFLSWAGGIILSILAVFGLLKYFVK